MSGRSQLERESHAADQARQAAIRAAEQERRTRERGLREAARLAAADARDRQQRYLLGMKAVADAQTAELETLLTSSLDLRTELPFSGFKRPLDIPKFEPGRLAVSTPAPQWEDFAPRPPGLLSLLFGGRGRYERAEVVAREQLEQATREHGEQEQERHRRLAEAEQAHGCSVAKIEQEINEHNEAVDRFVAGFRAGDREAVEEYFCRVLAESRYPDDFSREYRTLYRPETKELIVECELPPQSIVPTAREFRYVKARDEIETIPRSLKEIKDRYALVVAQVALRTLREIFDVDAIDIVDTVVLNGHLSARDKATGQQIRPCLITVAADRQKFSELVLAEVDPAECLRYLNALVSPHPFDLDPVRPIFDYERFLAQYRLIDGVDVIARLDSRPDLLHMNPTEFEHLIRQLFDAMGMKSWVTQASRDEGVDAVVINPDPVVGGLCVVQAKRYSKVVGLEAVHALAGVMDDKRAHKGILVTTSWFGSASQQFADRNRIQLIKGKNLKHLLQEHLHLDAVVGPGELRTSPRGRQPVINATASSAPTGNEQTEPAADRSIDIQAASPKDWTPDPASHSSLDRTR